MALMDGLDPISLQGVPLGTREMSTAVQVDHAPKWASMPRASFEVQRHHFFYIQKPLRALGVWLPESCTFTNFAFIHEPNRPERPKLQQGVVLLFLMLELSNQGDIHSFDVVA